MRAEHFTIVPPPIDRGWKHRSPKENARPKGMGRAISLDMIRSVYSASGKTRSSELHAAATSRISETDLLRQLTALLGVVGRYHRIGAR